MRLADMDEHAEEIQTLMEEVWVSQKPSVPVFSPDQSALVLEGIWKAGRVAEPGSAGSPAEIGVIETVGRSRVRLLWRAAAAAILVGALGGGAWWWTRTQVPPQTAARLTRKVTDVPPGANKAVLILGDGSTVSLDSLHRGTLAKQGSTEIVQLGGGRLAYTRGGAAGATGAAGAESDVSFNTIRTPRGGQYQVTLPDGSRVWLNAASSLKFPTAFTGGDRTVELTGEAYFEVAARQNQPFRVKVSDMQVDVLGTHFDVMAYPEEGGVYTSLLQGAVRVGTQVLKPGQEARWSGGVLQVAEVDTDQAVAWKNGLFQFDGATLETIMHQVCRWYDVDVRYEGNVSRHFSGLISRSVPLTEVLHMLDLAGKARFSLEGRTVVVRTL